MFGWAGLYHTHCLFYLVLLMDIVWGPVLWLLQCSCLAGQWHTQIFSISLALVGLVPGSLGGNIRVVWTSQALLSRSELAGWVAYLLLFGHACYLLSSCGCWDVSTSYIDWLSSLLLVTSSSKNFFFSCSGINFHVDVIFCYLTFIRVSSFWILASSNLLCLSSCFSLTISASPTSQ